MKEIKKKMLYCGKFTIIVVWGLFVTMMVALTSSCSSTKPEFQTPQENFNIKTKRIRYVDTPNNFSSGYYQYCPQHHHHPMMK